MPSLRSAAPVVKLCATVVPTEAEDALADRLAWAADGGEPEDYPGVIWRQDANLPGGEILLEPAPIGRRSFLAALVAPACVAPASAVPARLVGHARVRGERWTYHVLPPGALPPAVAASDTALPPVPLGDGWRLAAVAHTWSAEDEAMATDHLERHYGLRRPDQNRAAS